MPSAFLRLEESEAQVVQAASRIYAAYVSSGAVTPENEEELVGKAVRVALYMAQVTDQLVLSDDENPGGVSL
jgi:hypothetical protein